MERRGSQSLFAVGALVFAYIAAYVGKWLMGNDGAMFLMLGALASALVIERLMFHQADPPQQTSGFPVKSIRQDSDIDQN